MIAFILLAIELSLLRYWIKKDPKYSPLLDQFETFIVSKSKIIFNYFKEKVWFFS